MEGTILILANNNVHVNKTIAVPSPIMMPPDIIPLYSSQNDLPIIFSIIFPIIPLMSMLSDTGIAAPSPEALAMIKAERLNYQR